MESLKTEQYETIKKELELLSKTVAPCLQCATCASSCPVFQLDSTKNPRRIVYRMCHGDIESILDADDFWWCGGCYSCEAHCPQGVPLTRVFFRLKNLAFKQGKRIPDNIKRMGEALATGIALPDNERIKKTRQKLRLPNRIIPDTEEIEKILKITEFDLC